MIRSGMSRLLAAAAVVAVLMTLVPTMSAVATAPGAPPPRGHPAMAYDAAHGQVVLFGGYSGGYLRDTWAWDGADWTRRSPAHSPSARFGHSMAYDSARSQIVLFGGYNDARFNLRDTWTWDGSDWTKRSPAHSPPPLLGMGMAYDDARGS
jgi:hypothetical protein